VEVRGFEPRTPCMPSARSRFDGVRHRSLSLQLLDSSSGSVHINPPECNSTAEVTAEVDTSAVTSASNLMVSFGILRLLTPDEAFFTGLCPTCQRPQRSTGPMTFELSVPMTRQVDFPAIYRFGAAHRAGNDALVEIEKLGQYLWNNLEEDCVESVKPFLIAFAEPGPQPELIDGRYEPQSQTWVGVTSAPTMRTSQGWINPTLHPTTHPTPNSDGTPDTYEDSETKYHDD